MKLYLKCTDYDKEFINPDFDLILRANNDQTLDVFFLDEHEDGLNINGAVVLFTVKNKPTDTDLNAVLTKTISSTQFPNPMSGEASIVLTDTDTASLLGNYLYDIKIKFLDGTIKTAAEGTICFQRSLSARSS